ncbi:hypothetical protein [Desertibacillus haloalkaliphilus]|uniref:hypothetical protein n=1 Tax=Desertibacillus haloalkaliphilus TaxID=1328930 RepID=UPI001C2725F4|nr:hypothetical protein [Desertibacillus haloalkaliphilus]MBU8905363.1 hypothetical protein [Desertibacillus haloalkaliphilus]
MDRTRFLLRVAAIYALIGIFMGSHMAGAGSLALRPIHAHILVVGWLSLFAFAAFYKLFVIPKTSKLANIHVWGAFIGSIGLNLGMYLYYMYPGSTFNLIFYIVGGTILMLSFVAFALMTFVHGRAIKEAE